MLHLGDRHRRVLDPEVRHVRAFAAEVGDQRIVGVQGQLRRRAARAPARPSGRRSSRARRSGRAGRGTGCRAASRAGGAPARRDRARTRRSRTARARRRSARRAVRAVSSVEATPPAMFAPARLCTSGEPGAFEHRGRHRRGGGLAVGRRDDRRAARSRAASSLDRVRVESRSAPCPGRLVPPPRPARRASSPTARAARILASSTLMSDPAGTITLTAAGSARTVTGSSAIGSPSAYMRERPVEAEIRTEARAQHLDVGQAHVRALEAPSAAAAGKLEPGHVPDRHHVEQAVLRARRRGPGTCRRRMPWRWRRRRCSR